MRYVANSNQATDLGTVVCEGQPIPDGALSEDAIKTLLAVGLLREVTEDEAAAIKPPEEG